jgi:hypothetical protein
MTDLKTLFTPQCSQTTNQTTEPTLHPADEECFILILILALLAWGILPTLLEGVVRLFSNTSPGTLMNKVTRDVDISLLQSDEAVFGRRGNSQGEVASIMQRHYGVPFALDQIRDWERKKLLSHRRERQTPLGGVNEARGGRFCDC